MLHHIPQKKKLPLTKDEYFSKIYYHALRRLEWSGISAALPPHIRAPIRTDRRKSHFFKIHFNIIFTAMPIYSKNYLLFRNERQRCVSQECSHNFQLRHTLTDGSHEQSPLQLMRAILVSCNGCSNGLLYSPLVSFRPTTFGDGLATSQLIQHRGQRIGRRNKCPASATSHTEYVRPTVPVFTG